MSTSDESRWPASLLALYYLSFSIITVVYPEVEDAPALKVYRILYVLLLATSLANMFSANKVPHLYRNRIPWKAYVAGLSILCLSVTYAPASAVDIWDQNSGLIGRIVVIALYWIAATLLLSEKNLRYVVASIIATGLAISLWVVHNAWLSGFSAGRAGLEVNQNVVVDFIAIGTIPLIDFCCAVQKAAARFMIGIAIAICLYGVYLTGSRGAALALTLAAGTIVWKRCRDNRVHVARALAGMALICGLVFFLPGDENVFQRFRNTPESSEIEEPRVYVIWPLLLEQLSSRGFQQWLIGEGMDSSSSLLLSTFNNAGWGDAHNAYLQAVYDQGLIGLGAFLLFLWSIRRCIPQAPGNYQSLFCGWFVYFAIAAMFEVEANGKIFWIILGVMAGTCALSSLQRIPRGVTKNQVFQGRVLGSMVGRLP